MVVMAVAVASRTLPAIGDVISRANNPLTTDVEPIMKSLQQGYGCPSRSSPSQGSGRTLTRPDFGLFGLHREIDRLFSEFAQGARQTCRTVRVR
jgi:hypothetical protein